MKYELYVDDNYYYMDEDERYKAGEFETLENAIAEAKRIVDEFLLSVYEKNPEISWEKLFEEYTKYGEDPWIHPNYSDYNSWEYAEKRSIEICGLREPVLKNSPEKAEKQKTTSFLGSDVDNKMIS